MTEEKERQQPQLIKVLREGISLVQMILFKELGIFFAEKYPEKERTERSLLSGAIINSLFGVENPGEKFRTFKQRNHALIEQELIGFANNFQHLLPAVTDALRVQTLCDHQEGSLSPEVLQQAEELGILVSDREVPLPSTFMTQIRVLGEKHNLTIAPVQISPEEDLPMH
ncbi:MAG: hypothetical protein V2I36_09430 [Desulfopila sp.]|jgi:hypothetical protein|nr:hypothetical protein [Desulfopila sp.]